VYGSAGVDSDLLVRESCLHSTSREAKVFGSATTTPPLVVVVVVMVPSGMTRHMLLNAFRE
jgi:hypothetical protein